MAQYPPVKRRRVSPPDSDSADTSGDHTLHNFARNAAKWNLEQDYEQRPRKLKSKENTRLPIKTVDGWIPQETPAEPDNEDVDSFLESDEDELPDADEGLEEEEEKPKISSKQQILEAKEELARLAALINEDPEEHIGCLKKMAQLTSSGNITVRKLCLVAQCQVYKDIIPSYRIRPREDDSKEKISKDVRKLRNYEQIMVSAYQNYVKELEKLSRRPTTNTDDVKAGLVSVAVSCACNLLLAVPHFNFRGDLIKIAVSQISSNRSDEIFDRCIDTFQALFENDEEGHTSLDAISQITKIIKAKGYNVREEVLNTFLHLRLLSEFSTKGSQHSINKDEDASPGKMDKKQKEKRGFRTKKVRKMMRENKAIEKEMREADAVVGHEERDKAQAEMLKMVFATYFRILKAQTSHLMGAVLEGLAKYSHLINQDFFGDILEALKDLIKSSTKPEEIDADDAEDGSRDSTRESLLCTITAFALLEGQDASSAANTLHLDLDFFITHLYRTLFPAAMNADIELSSKSRRLTNSLENSTAAPSKVNIQTTAVLLLRSLSSTLLPPTALRSVPPTRIAAFTKQLMTAALQLPEKSCVAVLSLLQQVAKIHGRKVKALWYTEERRGDGVFDPLREEYEGSNPFATTIWEGELLRLHYSPKVRDAVKEINKAILGV